MPVYIHAQRDETERKAGGSDASTQCNVDIERTRLAAELRNAHRKTRLHNARVFSLIGFPLPLTLTLSPTDMIMPEGDCFFLWDRYESLTGRSWVQYWLWFFEWSLHRIKKTDPVGRNKISYGYDGCIYGLTDYRSDGGNIWRLQCSL